MTIIERQETPIPGTGTSTTNPAAAEAVFGHATARLLTPLQVRAGDTVVDVGPGAGSATLALAEAVGEGGRVHVVDVDPAMLEATMNAVGNAGFADRVRPILHDLESGPPPMNDAVDAVWSSACVHHTRDWGAAVRALASLLRPGGSLCIAEGGLPSRSIPWDCGVGKPGLETRLDAAHNRWSTQWFAGRAGVRRYTGDWGEILGAAGLEGVTRLSTLIDYPAPLDEQVRGVVLDELAARVRRAGPFLDDSDAAAWKTLLDPADAQWLGHRPDLALLTVRTAFYGRRPQ